MSDFIDLFSSLRTVVFASALATVFVYFQTLKEYVFGRKLTDSAGNGIPPGPVGLPIVGECIAAFEVWDFGTDILMKALILSLPTSRNLPWTTGPSATVPCTPCGSETSSSS